MRKNIARLSVVYCLLKKMVIESGKLEICLFSVIITHFFSIRCDIPSAQKVFCVRNFEMGLLWVPRASMRRFVIPQLESIKCKRNVTCSPSPKGGLVRSDGTVEFPLPFKIPGKLYTHTALPSTEPFNDAQLEDIVQQLSHSMYYLLDYFKFNAVVLCEPLFCDKTAC